MAGRIIMRQRILLFIFVLATASAAVGAEDHTAPNSTETSHATRDSPQPLILQEGDGEQLVHSSGPLSGLPFIIKLDGQNGNTQDFFVFTETLARGQSIPFHKHDNAEEILIVENGDATVIVGNKRAVAAAHSIVFIPRDTWISATNTGAQDIHLVSVFSRHGFERYLRSISAKPGEAANPVPSDQLSHLRALGHSMYWDTSKGPYPPGVAHP
jgi:quercetin dioxygenase-like cupin family protein